MEHESLNLSLNLLVSGGELDVATVATFNTQNVATLSNLNYNLHVDIHYSVLHIFIYLITKSRWLGWGGGAVGV